MRRLFRRKSRPSRTSRRKREIPRPIGVAGQLLGLQGVGFLILAVITAPKVPILSHPFVELWQPGLYVSLAGLSVLSALSLLRLCPLAWNLAMLLQGTSLLLALTLYLGERPFYIYPQMIYGILMVLELNQPELVSSFPKEIINSQEERKR